MQINGRSQSLDEVLDAGIEVWEQMLESLRSRGLDLELGTSVLAIAAAGASTYEGLTGEQFAAIVNQTLMLWSLEHGEDGPVLVFNGGEAEDADTQQQPPGAN